MNFGLCLLSKEKLPKIPTSSKGLPSRIQNKLSAPHTQPSKHVCWFSLTRIFLYKDRLVDSVIMRENMGQRKFTCFSIFGAVRKCLKKWQKTWKIWKLQLVVGLVKDTKNKNISGKKKLQNLITGFYFLPVI